LAVSDWVSLKGRRPITMLTGYDFSLAAVMDAVPQLDVLLVGDSVANVVYGHLSTREVRTL
jgi:ketopantoate hydroxymethyltransferase